jgi:hypothetical protein
LRPAAPMLVRPPTLSPPNPPPNIVIR